LSKAFFRLLECLNSEQIGYMKNQYINVHDLQTKYCLLRTSGVQSRHQISMSIWKIIVVVLLIYFGQVRLQAQSVFSPDELFQQARSAAFDKKDYPKAIELARIALEKSPGYTDIRTFLGRLYTWTGKYDLAKSAFLSALEDDPENEDVLLALLDLEYWNEHYNSALAFCDNGLKLHSDQEELLLRKAKILNALARYGEAYRVTADLIKKYPKNHSARSLLQSIRFDSSMNKVSISDDFTWFDGNYSDYLHNYPWNVLSMDYSRFTGVGPVIARINYGNRFNKEAFQLEMDAYPHLFKNVTAYVNIGVSDQSAVFPHYRVGLSLYADLPSAFEAEAGFRLLYFSSSTWIYVAGVSKYYSNFWFNGRVYLVPDNQKMSHSYSLSTRYYFGGTDDYWKLSIGYGLSPDDANSTQSFVSDYKLRSKQFLVGFRKSVCKFNVVGFSVSLLNQEFGKGVYGNQINTSVTYIRKF